MKRKLLFLLTVIIVMATLCLTVSAMEGSGSEADPYIVKTAEDFVAIKNGLSNHYKLDADLNLSSDSGAIVEGEFKGVFDGNGHTITLAINAPTNMSTDTFDALFGVVSGKIKNLTVDGSVSGSNKVAGIVGKLLGGGNVDNCINYATVYGRKNVGGVIGLILQGATVTNCANYGDISGTSISKGVDMGGIVGCVWEATKGILTIENCYNEGSVTGNGENCGGICGYFYGGNVKNVFNLGEITSTNQSSAGMIYGKLEYENNRTYKMAGYFSTDSEKTIGIKNGEIIFENPMLDSDGVAIYLGNGSGIRGEFHVNKEALSVFCKFADLDLADVEYGALVSTAPIVEQFGGNLTSQEAIDSQKVIFAPAMQNGEQKYVFVDDVKGDSFHSYRFALTGFPDNSQSYNMEFVILGYIKLADSEGHEILSYVNTVESIDLAYRVGDTKLNAVSIVRVAEVTVADGDFADNEEALG